MLSRKRLASAWMYSNASRASSPRGIEAVIPATSALDIHSGCRSEYPNGGDWSSVSGLSHCSGTEILTCIVLSPSAIGRQTVREILDGVLGGEEIGFSHQSRSLSTHCVVDSGISSSPGDGNIAIRRSIVDNWDSIMSAGKMDGSSKAMFFTVDVEVTDIEQLA